MADIKKQWSIVLHFWRRYAVRSVVLYAGLFIAGILEAFGILAILPLLDLMFEQQAAPQGMLQPIMYVFATLGLPLSIEVILSFMVVLFFLKAVILFVVMRYVGYTVAQIAYDTRLKLLKRILGVSWSFFVKSPLGHFVNALTIESSKCAALYLGTCKMMQSFLTMLVLLTAAAFSSWQVSLFVLVAGSASWVILGRFVSMAGRAGQKQASLNKALSKKIADHLQGIKPLKAMALEEKIQPILVNDIEGMQAAQQQQVIAKHGLNLFREPVFVCFIALAAFFILNYLSMTVSELLVVIALFYRSAASWGQFQQTYQQFCTNEHFFHSLNNMQEQASNLSETSRGGNKFNMEGVIRFQNISFSYGEAPLYRNLSLEIQPKKLTVITGASGQGKTTLLDLLSRLYQPQDGRICVDDINIAEIDLNAWRRNIGYVPQEFIAFHNDIYNNITLGDESISESQVVNALKQAQAWDFVVELSDGLRTVIGEKGVRLSGGQRQRISIARALVREPKLLILDEVTTSLDPKTEEKFCAIIQSLASKITVVAISHQNAILQVADYIYELQNGTILQKETSRITS